MAKRVKSTLEKVARWAGAEDEARASIKAERAAERMLKKGFDPRGAGISLAKKASRPSLLSPSGLTEDVVGRVLKNMGADEEPMYKKMQRAKRPAVTGRPRGKA